jgi:hypothetical protein
MSSLSSLSTELDERILAFLDHGALNAVSKVSKYYRAIAEPHLYGDLRFNDTQVKALKALMLTVISRLDLAAHIQIIRFSQHFRELDEADDEAFYQRFLHEMPAVQAAMVVMLGPGAPAKLLVDWVGAVAGPCSAEGCVAFIIGCAINIHCLHVAPRPSGFIFSKIMSAICGRWTVGSPVPYQKLKDIQLEDVGHCYIPILPSLETLGLIHTGTHSLSIHPALLSSADFSLRTIAIRESDISPGALTTFIKSVNLSNLTDFIIFQPFSTWSMKGIRKLIHTLAQHCRTLKRLDLVNVEEYLVPTNQPLECFLQLRSLKTLAIDFNILFQSGSLPDTLDPFTKLPPSLDYLRVTQIPHNALSRTLEPHLATSEKAIDYMRGLMRVYPITRISLTVDIESEGGNAETLVDSDEVKLLGTIAIALAEMGTILEVHEETWDTNSRLLVRGHEAASVVLEDRE